MVICIRDQAPSVWRDEKTRMQIFNRRKVFFIATKHERRYLVILISSTIYSWQKPTPQSLESGLECFMRDIFNWMDNKNLSNHWKIFTAAHRIEFGLCYEIIWNTLKWHLNGKLTLMEIDLFNRGLQWDKFAS